MPQIVRRKKFQAISASNAENGKLRISKNWGSDPKCMLCRGKEHVMVVVTESVTKQFEYRNGYVETSLTAAGFVSAMARGRCREYRPASCTSSILFGEEA